MLWLVAAVALARDVVVVGERYASASAGGWPDAMAACLDDTRPGAFVVADGTVARPSFATMHRALALAPQDAVVIVAAPSPAGSGLLGRMGWRHALGVLLQEAAAPTDRTVLLFGPWPAARRRVRASGSVPASAIRVEEADPDWAAAAEVAAAAGVRDVPWKGPITRMAEGLQPASRSGASYADARADVPRMDPASLGRLACAAVLEWAEAPGGAAD